MDEDEGHDSKPESLDQVAEDENKNESDITNEPNSTDPQVRKRFMVRYRMDFDISTRPKKVLVLVFVLLFVFCCCFVFVSSEWAGICLILHNRKFQ